MKKLTLKNLSDKRLIRLAELAFASKIENAFVYKSQEEVDVVYVFDIRDKKNINEDYIKKYGLSHVTSGRFDFFEIDSSFNVQINGGNTCNMALIYKLLFSWGADVDFQGTGLFPKTKLIPKTLKELESLKSESIN